MLDALSPSQAPVPRTEQGRLALDILASELDAAAPTPTAPDSDARFELPTAHPPTLASDRLSA